MNGTLVSRLGADQLILETRDKLPGAEHQTEILGFSACEFRAVHSADEIECD